MLLPLFSPSISITQLLPPSSEADMADNKYIHKLLCIQPVKISSNGLWTGDNPLSFSLPLVCLQLSVVVVTTRLVYMVLKPLKQPRVVSDIIGGLLLGPSGLGRNETFRNFVFPERGLNMLDTAAMFGLMYCIFLIGVRTDLSLLRKSGRKATFIGLSGVFMSFSVVITLSYLLSGYLSKALKNILFLSFLGATLCVTPFPVLVPILSEFHVLNSELGRLATSSAIMSDTVGYSFICLFVIMNASLASPIMGLWAFLALFTIVVFIFCVIRPWALWVIRTTPRGKPVDEKYIFVILVTVGVVGFISDMVGANSFNGALVLGLAIQDGPPLGSALVEKLDCFTSEVLMPLFYVMSGLKTNVFAITDGKSWGVLTLILVVGFVGKIVGTMLPTLFLKMPLRDATCLSLILCVKGIVELLTYNYWWDVKLIDDQTFAVLVLWTVTVTAIVSPIFMLLYEPSARYIVRRRRTILHSNPDEEIHILACVHSQANVPTVINLLEASNPSPSSPLVIFAVHVVELLGRAVPIMISHRHTHAASSSTSRAGGASAAASQSDHIINAFRIYEQRHDGAATVHPYTAVAPYHTIHDDICQLALTRGVVLIIIPFHKLRRLDGQMEASRGARTMNHNILHYAPCSVGILVDRAPGSSLSTLIGKFEHYIAIFFFGGDDDREALAYVTRMARHPGVSVTAIRFLSSASVMVRTRERKLDNDAFIDFRAKNVGNPRVIHREVVVTDLEQILGVIRALDIDSFDLFVVGMRHESTLITDEMAGWSESPELGVIGDLLASSDFGSTTSILVVRQQVNLRLHVPGQPTAAAQQEEEYGRAGVVDGGGGNPSPIVHSPIRMIQDGASVRFRSAQQMSEDEYGLLEESEKQYSQANSLL